MLEKNKINKKIIFKNKNQKLGSGGCGTGKLFMTLKDPDSNPVVKNVLSNNRFVVLLKRCHERAFKISH